MIIVFFITFVVILILVRLYIVYQEQIKFFLSGLDKGFKVSEIYLLFSLARQTDLTEPSALFYSEASLNKAIAKFVNECRADGSSNEPKNQKFISKLYEYRTKLDIEKENKKVLDSTRYLDKGQRLRIILKGRGVYTSEIVNNGTEMVIKLPVKKGKLIFDGKEWVGKSVSVYLWRKGDAGYVFDTTVTNSGVFNGQNVIYLAQTSSLERAQKRKSIRSQCQIYAQLYFLDPDAIDFDYVEVEKGFKCLLEDISEDGALIRIGGMGKPNVQIKIQFEINGTVIVMFGIIRSVEYNQQSNQSRLHFECLHMAKDMRNEVLSYVYTILPEDKKEVLEAISQTEEDQIEDEKKKEGPQVTNEENGVFHNEEHVPIEESVVLPEESSPDFDV